MISTALPTPQAYAATAAPRCERRVEGIVGGGLGLRSCLEVGQRADRPQSVRRTSCQSTHRSCRDRRCNEWVWEVERAEDERVEWRVGLEVAKQPP